MPQVDWLILMGMGGLFLILGIALVIWGKRDESSYYNSLSTRTDVRKFLERESRPRFESLKVGGWLAIAVGLVMIAMGGAFWRWG
jgi:hypothetical protein